MTKTYHKTVIKIEVLSEERYALHSLEQVAYDITEGDCSGQWFIESAEEVDGPTMARLLLAQGSDPGFFGLE